MFESIVEAVLQHAEKTPTKLCLVDDKETVTYEQYAHKICALATLFKAHDVKALDKILVEGCQRIDYLAIQLALQLIGAIFVPIEHNCAVNKIQSFVKRINPKMIILCKDKSVKEIDRAFSLDDISSKIAAFSPFKPNIYPKYYDVCEILFTTGTTGTEKGIILTNKNDLSLAENAIFGALIESDNVEFILSPFNHSHGLRRYYANMYVGGSVIMQQSIINIADLYKKIETYNVNSMDMVPSALSVLLSITGDDLGNYKDKFRYIQLGAAPLPENDKATLKRLLPSTRLLNMYGSTESGISCIYNFNVKTDKKNCIGKPSKNSNIQIVDDDCCPISSSIDNPGLLSCISPANMRGYWNDDGENDLTAQDQELHAEYSNDIAYFDEDGDIILLGRKGDIINIGGKKVSPSEIENETRLLEGIVDCCCIPVADEFKGQVPKLFVQMNKQLICEFDAIKIRNHLAKNLEPYKVPVYIVKIEKVPRTYKGSLQRNLLK